MSVQKNWLGCAAILALAIVAALQFGPRTPKTTAPRATTAPEPPIAAFGGSPSCAACHKEEFVLWQKSHHASAERRLSLARDSSAFSPTRTIRHGTQISSAQLTPRGVQLHTAGIDGRPEGFALERVIGVAPLEQFLVPSGGGRFQVTELAFDPQRQDWFDVYGNEDRKPGEWGHWTGRGMTWNSMCAACHNTSVRKNYLEPTDSYSTTLAEMSVGCESCHGPMAAHNRWQAAHPNQAGDPTLRPVRRQAMFDVCGSCHARRVELTGQFRPGDNFSDHFALVVPDETDVFYPDGQVRDEDFEFTAFEGSRMHAAGIRCIDCHEPHSAQVRIPGNNLCMVCHAAPAPPAPKIDPATHSHHQAGQPGDSCADCHMPQTLYMQRHARHDHGFTIPDPLLTKEFGIPNACSRCHTNQSLQWVLQAADKWYGQRMERPTRTRARILARARAGDDKALPELLGLLKTETNGFWRAVSAGLLRHWADAPQITSALISSLRDPDPLARALGARALEPVAPDNPAIQESLRNSLEDPIRAVRIEAEWALRRTIDTNSVPGRELMTYLAYNGDQPPGAFQLGVFHLDRGELNPAMSYLRRAVDWDARSAPLHEALATGLSLEQKQDEAVQELETACALAPRDAQCRFKLGLALNEDGQIEKACAVLKQSVELDPRFARGWYNLGLAYNSCGKTQEAIESLVRAESIDDHSPDIPFARATILARLGRADQARAAARRALEIQPAYTQATQLLEMLSRP